MPGTGGTAVTSWSFESVHGSKQLENVDALPAQAGHQIAGWASLLLRRVSSLFFIETKEAVLPDLLP